MHSQQKLIFAGGLLLLCSLAACNSQPPRNLPILGSCDQGRSTARAPDDYREMINPLKFNSATLDAGEELYMDDAKPVACVKCHGKEGDGMGPMANMFNPAPRNFTCAEGMNVIEDGQLFWIIKHGSPGTSMPAFDKLEDEQIWQLVAYLRNLAH
jgi:cytochrome c553